MHYRHVAITCLLMVVAFTKAFSIYQVDTLTNPSCDTLYFVDGTIKLVEIYSHDEGKVLYKLCQEEGNPRRAIATNEIAGIYEQKTQHLTIYQAISTPEQRAEIAKNKDPIITDKAMAKGLGFLAGLVIAPILGIIAPIVLGRELTLGTLLLGYVSVLVVAIASTLKKYKGLIAMIGILSFTALLFALYLIGTYFL